MTKDETEAQFIGGGGSFWDQGATASEPLSAEVLLEGMRKMWERFEAEASMPRGPCGCTATIVGPKTYERLKTEGGIARCANCANLFEIPDPRRQEA